MKKATLDQASKILSLFEGVPLQQLQNLLGSGLLADLRDANVSKINRYEFRRVCGLKFIGSVFPLWRILTIGGVPKDELVRILGDGFYVSDWAKDIMSKSEFTTLSEPTDIHLARAKVKDLGFTEPPTTTELFTRIKEVGSLCPAEVGPHIRLADKDQLKGTGYWVAMEPITDSGGFPDVFSVGRDGDGERWLDAGYASPGGRWDLGGGVVFCLSK